MEDCVFCKIASHQMDSKIEYEDEDFIVLHDINPSAPSHVLIVPKEHMELLDDLADWEKIGGRTLLIAKKVAEKLGIKESGYKLVMNCGRGAGQTIDHLHVHLMGGFEN
jgi:histidine triad (HIT) family protein